MELRACPQRNKKTGLPESVDPVTGEAFFKYKFTGRHINKTNFKALNDAHVALGNAPYKLVGCGKCIGCKLEYSRKWADRLMIELDHSKKAVYLTLTYRDDALVYGSLDNDFNVKWASVCKEHIQEFNKKLRERFRLKGIPEIRFYTAAEYGPKTLRPHYHGIYFGISLDDIPECKFRKFNEHNQPLFHSNWLDDVWAYGDVTIGHVAWQNCAYVARYSLKKMGTKGFEAFERGVEPEFALMSRRPGIGGFFTIDHPEFFDNPRDKIYLNDPFGLKNVNSCSAPKFIFDKLKLVNPKLYDIIKEERQQFAEDRFFSELVFTDLDEDAYIDLKERLHEKSIKSLVRS